MTYFNLDVGEKEKSNDVVSRESNPASYSLLSQALSDADALTDLDLPLCATCSTQTSYSGTDLDIDSKDSTYKCVICLDPRQYIGKHGQRWTTLKTLIEQDNDMPRRWNRFDELIPGVLWTFKTLPAFGIGQRAFLIKDPALQGLIMWDCIAYMDDETLQQIDVISEGKGIAHMVISHPHYYSTTATWLAVYKNMRLWLAEVDFKEWYVRKDIVQAYSNTSEANDDKKTAKRIEMVKDEKTLPIAGCKDLAILLLGGHFPGSLVLLYKDILFIADTIQVVPSALYKSHLAQRPNVASVTFLWSYPNQIPLSAAEIKRVCAPLEKVEFTKAFGAFEGFDIWGHAKEKILDSRDLFCSRLSVG